MTTYPIKCRMRVENAATRVDVYDDIGESGWPGEGLTAKDFTDKLGSVSGPLDVHINSYGGSVKDGIAIGNAIRAHQGFKRTVVDGMAASIASVIMQAGDERVVQPGSMVMIHDASAACMGNAADMAKAASDLEKHSDNLAKQYAARAGGTPQQWRDAMKAETWYDADEAVAAGLADKVGAGAAALPAALDLAAFQPLPERVYARLQALPRRDPQAGYAPQPYTHESWENVQCPVCGKFSDDDARYCGQCGIELAGRDDVTTTRTASRATAGVATPIRAAAGGGEAMPCRTCSGKGRLPHPVTGKNGMKCPGCGGSGNVPTGDDVPEEEPDEEPTDALHHSSLDWLRKTAGARHPNTPVAAPPDELAAAAAIDLSDWDGDKAMSLASKAADPATAYEQICAGRRAGDPAKQESWALPYRYPGKGPNAAGVRNALSRLPQTDDLTNKAAAQALLERLMKQVNPDYDGGSENRMPSWITETQPAAPAWLNAA